MPDYLDAYNFFQRDRKSGYVLATEDETVTPALLEENPAGQDEQGGRGRIMRFPLHSGEGILRRYRRGGLAARILGDRYFHNRMKHEFLLTARLHAAGLPVPQPLGVVWERQKGCYRGALSTRALEATTLHAHLQQQTPSREVLLQTGKAIRALHDAGVWHADLQVMNILVGPHAVWLIDFDNARDTGAPSRTARARNLLRLRRSLEKHGQSLDNFHTIWEGYGKLGLPRWLSVLYRVRGMVSDALRK